MFFDVALFANKNEGKKNNFGRHVFIDKIHF